MRFLHSLSPRGFSQLWTGAAICSLVSSTVAQGIPLDLESPDSIKAAAKTVAHEMMSYYNGNETGGIPGLLPEAPVRYFWWEAGAMFGSLLDYYYYTGNSEYNEVTTQALLFQTGPNNDYMPPNQTKNEGNDDQAFWGMAAMTAAEQNFPNPPADKPQWLALAQAVFNSQALRWDDTTCGGGLRWQIFSFNNGYDYKNSISNGCFFNLAARLATYTGNKTYSDWAEKSWQWVNAIGLMDPEYRVFDGSDDTINCTRLNHIQWSYNAGVFLLGAASMYNNTNGSPIWRDRLQGLLDATEVFFHPEVRDVMFEVACEPNGKCNTDQLSFKAYLARWMAATTKLAPFTYDFVQKKLRASAAAAAAQCSGGTRGTSCGTLWTNNGVYDGTYGVGQQMSALEVIQSNLIKDAKGPLSIVTGGTSKGDPSAGTGGTSPMGPLPTPVTTRDRVGAGIITTIFIVFVLGSCVWMMF